MLDQKSASCANFSAPNAAEKGGLDSLLETLKQASEDQQERLGKLESLLRLIDSAMDDSQDRYISRLAIDIANEAYNFHDMAIGTPLFRLAKSLSDV